MGGISGKTSSALMNARGSRSSFEAASADLAAGGNEGVEGVGRESVGDVDGSAFGGGGGGGRV